MTAGDATHTPPPKAAAARDPATEEKVRIIILSGLQLWMLLTQNPIVRAKLFNAIITLSYPEKWAVIADLFWGS
jgi:hypothetical protein